jgi:hypothetical protein
MLNSNQKAFLTLCESIVYEASSLPAVIGTGMAATAIMKHIHSKMEKTHDVAVKSIPSIELADIKKYGGFYIIQGELGYVAITGGRYGMQLGGVKKGQQQVASVEVTGVPQLRKFVKEYAGKLEKYWRGTDRYGGDNRDIKGKRAQLRTVNRAVVNTDSLFERFRPLFTKAAQLAVNDIRGIASNMIKTGNYSDAERKLRVLARLDNHLQTLEINPKLASKDRDYTIRGTKDFFSEKIQDAIETTAHHFYGQHDDPTAKVSVSQEHVNQLFSDIQNGDTKKLSALLAYFKSGLVR